MLEPVGDLFVEANAIARRDPKGFIRSLLPGARLEGQRMRAAQLGGGEGRSLSVDVATGAWIDHATGETGSDFVSLYAAVRMMLQAEAAKEIVNSGDYASRAEEGPGGVKLRSSSRGRCEWAYYDADGKLAFYVTREHCPKHGKRFRVRDDAGNWRMPARYEKDGTRPLYRLPEIMARPAEPVIVVEGEKAADAVVAAGYLATTSASGSRAAKKTSWKPLAGRRVVIWPDNDDPGRAYAADVRSLIRAAGGAQVTTVEAIEGEELKADAADYPPEAIRERIEASLAKPFEFTILQGCGSGRFDLEPPPVDWLIEGIIARKMVTLVAGEGGIGKGILALDLAWKSVLFSAGRLGLEAKAFGRQVMDGGAVVYMALEDGEDDIHRRIAMIDPLGERLEIGDRLIACPLERLGGHMPVVEEVNTALAVPERWAALEEELGHVDNLAMLICDPLARFVAAAIEEDPRVAHTMYAQLSALAARLNIAVVVTHHMGKYRQLKNQRITNMKEVRDLIRGSGAIVDGVRSAYALWCEPDQEEARKALDEAYTKARTGKVRGILERHIAHAEDNGAPRYGAVVYGGVVKSNVAPYGDVTTFVRDTGGLLVPVE